VVLAASAALLKVVRGDLIALQTFDNGDVILDVSATRSSAAWRANSGGTICPSGLQRDLPSLIYFSIGLVG